MLIKYMCLKTD